MLDATSSSSQTASTLGVCLGQNGQIGTMQQLRRRDFWAVIDYATAAPAPQTVTTLAAMVLPPPDMLLPKSQSTGCAQLPQRNKRTVVYLSTFDPPHMGDVRACVTLLKADFHDIMLVPEKHSGDMNSVQHYCQRLQMCVLLSEYINTLSPNYCQRVQAASLHELLQPHHEPLFTLQALQTKNATKRYCLAISPQKHVEAVLWSCYETLRKRFPIIVFKTAAAEHQERSESEAIPFADQDIKEWLRCGKDVRAVVPDAVAQFMRRNGLYGLSSQN